MANGPSIQEARGILQGLPDEERKSFINNFNKLDSDQKRQIALERLMTNSQAQSQVLQQPVQPQANPVDQTQELIQQREAIPIAGPVEIAERAVEAGPLGIKQEAQEVLLQNVGALGQRAEAAVANPVLAVQQGLKNKEDFGTIFRKAIEGIGAGITGEQVGEFGDIARSLGAPEPVAVGSGLLTDLLVGAGVFKLAKGTQLASETITRRSAKLKELAKEQEELATRIIQPGTADLKKALKKKRVLPSVQVASEQLKEAKSYDDLLENVQENTNKIFTERNSILEKFNAPINQDKFIDELTAEFNKEVARKTRKPAEIKQISEWIDNEVDFLSTQPNIDTLLAQGRKEELQRSTARFLEKKFSDSGLTGEEAAEDFAKDLIRKAYKNAVEGSIPQAERNAVRNINKQYEGILDLTDSLAAQAALFQKAAKPGAIRKGLSSIGELVGTLMGGDARNITLSLARKRINEGFDLSRSTARLQKLKRQSDELRADENFLRDLITPRSDEVTPAIGITSAISAERNQ